MRPLIFLGSTQDDLRGFPREVRRVLGDELLRIQLGGMPTDFKPMKIVGSGVYEIRANVDGAWRVIYVARFESAIFVLHAFQKKSQKTNNLDIELARKRYGMIGDLQ